LNLLASDLYEIKILNTRNTLLIEIVMARLEANM
jgi:hypothetical protein